MNRLPGKPDARAVLLALPVAVLNLSARSANGLKRLGVSSVRDLTKLSAGELCGTPSFGAACLAEVRDTLKRHGLALARPSGIVATLKPDHDADPDRLLSGLRKAARRAGFILVEAKPVKPELEDAS
jgi:Bacterial RNA polymerase, alpha chain C terminal domain